MSGARRCAICGATIPTGRGECPRCLLELAIPTAGDCEAPEAAPATRRAAPPSPGELAASFPQLEILGLLGEGGMGVVYRARHRQLEREVALKILAPGVDEPRFAERFLGEARTLARLDHPGIVRVHDFGAANGRPYLLMELVEGASLRERMRAGPIPPGEALGLLGQICEALQYAHDEGIVHRDIKPENVLIDRKGRVKLVDFGLAKLVLGSQASRATQTGVWLGTPSYMAPEQLRAAAPVDHRADLYSLGVVLYEMLTGELPDRDLAPPAKGILVDLRLDRIVLKSLEQVPERRYQHALEIRTDLEQDRPAAPAAVAGTGVPRRRRAIALAGYGLALLVLWRLTWLCFAAGPLVSSLGVVAIALVGCRMLHVLDGREPASRRAARLATALVGLLLALASAAWIAHTLRQWEHGVAGYTPPPDEPERLAAMGPETLGGLAASPELLASWQLVPTRRDVLDVSGWLRWAGFAPLAFGLWLAASAVALRAARGKSGRTWWGYSLAATGALGLAALLGSWALPVARGAWPAEELTARPVVPADTLDEIETRLRLWLLEEGFQVETALYWDIQERDTARPIGRAALLLAQASSPFERWRFRPWAGPERRSPRVLGLLTDALGTRGGRLDAGSLSVESGDVSGRSEWQRWLATGAERLRGG